MTADNQESAAHRPCMIVAHGDLPYAESLGRSFRRLGWDVYQCVRDRRPDGSRGCWNRNCWSWPRTWRRKVAG